MSNRTLLRDAFGYQIFGLFGVKEMIFCLGMRLQMPLRFSL